MATQMKQRKYGLPDAESPEWGEREFSRARRATEALPEKVFEGLTGRKPGQRGPQRTPTKVRVSLRLDRDIVERFKAQGPGWQTRINEALRVKRKASR
jgi:uncharacterized protein (DUF4415 family)